jgi:hypothetical protein
MQQNIDKKEKKIAFVFHNKRKNITEKELSVSLPKKRGRAHLTGRTGVWLRLF